EAGAEPARRACHEQVDVVGRARGAGGRGARQREAADEREVPEDARDAAGAGLEARGVPDPLRAARQELLAPGEAVEAVARHDERVVVQPPRELVPADRDARVAPRLVERDRAVEDVAVEDGVDGVEVAHRHSNVTSSRGARGPGGSAAGSTRRRQRRAIPAIVSVMIAPASGSPMQACAPAPNGKYA